MCGRGHAMAAFVRGRNAAGADSDYMMLVWSTDGGKGEGGISFYDWDQGPGWLNPLALLCAWNTIKFAWVAVASTAASARRVIVRPPAIPSAGGMPRRIALSCVR